MSPPNNRFSKSGESATKYLAYVSTLMYRFSKGYVSPQNYHSEIYDITTRLQESRDTIQELFPDSLVTLEFGSATEQRTLFSALD